MYIYIYIYIYFTGRANKPGSRPKKPWARSLHYLVLHRIGAGSVFRRCFSWVCFSSSSLMLVILALPSLRKAAPKADKVLPGLLGGELGQVRECDRDQDLSCSQRESIWCKQLTKCPTNGKHSNSSEPSVSWSTLDRGSQLIAVSVWFTAAIRGHCCVDWLLLNRHHFPTPTHRFLNQGQVSGHPDSISQQDPQDKSLGKPVKAAPKARFWQWLIASQVTQRSCIKELTSSSVVMTEQFDRTRELRITRLYMYLG